VPKLPRLKASEVIKTLERMGFVWTRQKGSHIIFKKTVDNREIGCVVPMHRKEIAIGTLKNILNQAGISVEEFIKNL
jgi:predicted RNA binding protein YcfA (HicA-like mRNA interferase family)